MQRFHYGLIAVALLAGTSLAAAQQDKTQQNSADEALTRSAPEAKDAPQAPPQASQNQASQPGTAPADDPLTQGKLNVPGAPQESEMEPAKYSAKNEQIDKTPIMAFPLALTDDQKRAIYQSIMQSNAPVTDIDAKPAEAVAPTLSFQDFPQDVAGNLPQIKDYKFLRTKDRILVVNPREAIVVGEISQ